MLAAEHFDSRTLPDDDLVYVAFRICYFDLFTELETAACLGTHNFEADPCGYLTSIPFFETVPPTVQLDMLAEVWAKHQSPMRNRAMLVDAAVVWAILANADWISREAWDGDLSIVLNGGPRKVSVSTEQDLDGQWSQLFGGFWDDADLLTVDDQQDLPREEARALRVSRQIPEEWVDGIYEVLGRCRASESILANLQGLLSRREIEEHRDVLLQP